MTWAGPRKALARFASGLALLLVSLVLSALAWQFIEFLDRLAPEPALSVTDMVPGTTYQGRLLFTGTAAAPALVFFADSGQAYEYRCGALWVPGCTTLQLQAAFARQLGELVVPDVVAEAHPTGTGQATVLFARAQPPGKAAPFLALELHLPG